MSTHRKPKPPSLYRRVVGWWHARRQRGQVVDIKAARDVAYFVRVEAHAPPPLTWARHAITAQIAAYSNAIAYLPPAAVLPDEDVPGLEHLQRTWDDDTGTFAALIAKEVPDA